MNADEWNSLYLPGTRVFAYPGARPEDIPSARRLVTRTRTKAQVSASGHPVVWVEGEGAYIALTHVDPVSKDAWEKAKTAGDCARAMAADVLLAELAKLRADRDASDREFEAVTADLATTQQQLATARTTTLAEVIGLIERFAAGAVERAAFRDLVTELRRLNAVAAPQEDDSDRRRRMYIDGHGEAWISLSHDSNIRYIGQLAGAFPGDETTDTVRERTGSLREIGRCW